MADELKRKGNDAFKAGKYQEAADWYTKVIAVQPQNEKQYSNRAACYTNLGKHQEALQDAEHCLQLKPAWVKSHWRKGVALSNLNRLPEALTAFEHAGRIEPHNAEVQQRVTQVRNTLKTQTSGADPSAKTDPEECKQLGNTEFKNGQYDKAIVWYTRAIELTESNATDETAVYLCNRALCHAQTHSYKQVVADCDAALAVNPKFVKAYLRRAQAFESLEKWQKAADDFKKALDLDSSAPNASQGYHRCLKFAKEQG
jgi:tetratricopeptide (TPR) repeat protein